MLINDIQTFVKFLKNQGQNIYHTPEQIDDAINRASLDLFRQEEKKFEENQILSDTLKPFKVKKVFALVPSGLYTIPTDYVRATNLAYDSDTVTLPVSIVKEAATFCDPDFVDTTPTPTVIAKLEHRIDLLVDSEWVDRQSDKIVPPSEENPMARIEDNTLQILPTTIAPILYYLKFPRKGKWAFTISGDSHSTIFDQANSTDLDWSEISHNEIIEKTMSLLGIPIRDNTLTQFEQLQKRNNNEQ